ncbi:MAG: phage tail protein, partial [Pseudomonadota bacterium]
FPSHTSLWADAENWITGHWLNGRVGRVRLGGVIEAIAAEAGLPGVDASACDQLISGLTLPAPAPARAALEPLFDLFQLDAVARDGVLIVKPRTGRTDITIEEGNLVDDGRSQILQVERVQDEEVPTALSITYQDELSGYEVKAIEVRDEGAAPGRIERIGTSVVLEQGEAEARARSILAEARGMRLTASFKLPPMADGLEVGDTVGMDVEGVPLRFRITGLTDNVVRTVRAVQTDPGVFVTRYGGLAADPDTPRPTFGSVPFAAMDLPLLDDGAPALWLATFAEPWPGEVAVYRGEGAARGLEASLSAPSLFGRLTDALAGAEPGRWDEASVLKVRLPAGGLSSVTASEVLEGANLAAVETSEGWELLQFRTATLQPDGSWHLTSLLRGRRGTEEAAREGAASQARFVLLGEALPTPLSGDRWGQTQTFHVGPATAPPGAFPFQDWSISIAGAGARPFAPAHLRASATPGGFALSWIRRTRIGGDHFGPGDVPLGESTERYQVTVEGPGNTVLNTFTVEEPSADLTEPSAVAVRIAQISADFGPGAEARLVLPS